MRRVRRRYTRPSAPVRDYGKSYDYPGVDMDIRTLTHRMKLLQSGESLYPWARTKMVIEDGKRKWVARTD